MAAGLRGHALSDLPHTIQLLCPETPLQVRLVAPSASLIYSLLTTRRVGNVAELFVAHARPTGSRYHTSTLCVRQANPGRRNYIQTRSWEMMDFHTPREASAFGSATRVFQTPTIPPRSRSLPRTSARLGPTIARRAVRAAASPGFPWAGPRVSSCRTRPARLTRGGAA